MADEDIKTDFDDDDFLFDSPAPKATQSAQDAPEPHPTESRFSSEEAREAALKQELENIRKINQVVEGVVESLEKAKSNMDTVSRTVNSASTLLQSWTRILSQTEHNQRLILNPRWQGATHDLSEIENDAVRKQQEAQRRQYEEQQRREAAARKAEAEERKKAAVSTRGTRGRVGTRGTTRPTSAASGTPATPGYTRAGGYGARAGRASSSTGRPGSSVGRTRGGRGRGVG